MTSTVLYDFGASDAASFYALVQAPGGDFYGTSGAFLERYSHASFTVVSDTFIEATVPARATTGFVTVNTTSGTLTSHVVFRVTPQNH